MFKKIIKAFVSKTGTTQVTIPKDVSRSLGIKNGDEIEFIYNADMSITLKFKKVDNE